MELVFLSLLVVLMILALGLGYPVAFALPGSAILAISAAALCGYLFAGNVDAYFVQGGPVQWLNAGVTNFRGIYWEVDRDTLIAIPLFVFMGIMLERSKIAEDLLVTMAQLFGPVPGGLGISVVFVGALLAATTGIVGATVIAMGLISLPVMMRHNYSNALATGTIAASGTLGQIIPPSIVLIILADQLASATDQASTMRKAAFKDATGEFSMPIQFDLASTSAGDMFMGAFFPGMVLVGLYMLYILVVAIISKKSAPPVPYEGSYDTAFAKQVFLSLTPPLALIFIVLGSIVFGIATVNQAGAIGAVGSMIMAGYRLMEGKRGAFAPAIVALVSIAAILVLINSFDINVKNIKGREDVIAVSLAGVAVAGLLLGVIWSGWRVYRIDDTLKGVMIETAKTTSLVFIILLGAAMLTAAFRAFGGEVLVKDFLTSLPGGFATKFIVVMAVIFLLGFFLDFIEIAVVVVPIVAPILLADPSANITAVWLGVMIGVNMQTSFLTPPFGFALFYLRGVAPPSVKTLQIYRGVVPFILLQLAALGIVGFYPSLVNYLPNRIYLTSENAPPPKNPTLQKCIEELSFLDYDRRADALRAGIQTAAALDASYLPEKLRDSLAESFTAAMATFDLVEKVRVAESALADYVGAYKPLHREVRQLQAQAHRLEDDLEQLSRDLRRLSGSDAAAVSERQRLEREIDTRQRQKEELERGLPEAWEDARAGYVALETTERKARMTYRRNVDDAYAPIVTLRTIIAQSDALAALEPQLRGLEEVIAAQSPQEAMETLKAAESAVRAIEGTNDVGSLLAKARRALKGDAPNKQEADAKLAEALDLYGEEVVWRRRAASDLSGGLEAYDDAVKDTIGLRLQQRLPIDIAKQVAACRSVHSDISLSF
jgi:tripartite ATP-independent transporter DctM subunit